MSCGGRTVGRGKRRGERGEQGAQHGGRVAGAQAGRCLATPRRGGAGRALPVVALPLCRSAGCRGPAHGDVASLPSHLGPNRSTQPAQPCFTISHQSLANKTGGIELHAQTIIQHFSLSTFRRVENSARLLRKPGCRTGMPPRLMGWAAGPGTPQAASASPGLAHRRRDPPVHAHAVHAVHAPSIHSSQGG